MRALAAIARALSFTEDWRQLVSTRPTAVIRRAEMPSRKLTSERCSTSCAANGLLTVRGQGER
jgi:hypothetical protein